jgi:hypothetical protein
MSRILLTIYCASRDGEAIAQALSDRTHAPVHSRSETVLGRDFGDAQPGERVSGTLARTAITIEIGAEQLAETLEAARAARRQLPFRWHSIAILDGGRVE